jgi:hypothetical protein
MARLEFPLQFKRQYAAPLDVDSIFDTTLERESYLKSPIRYAGQQVIDLEEGKAYFLNAAKDSWVLVGEVSQAQLEKAIKELSGGADFTAPEGQIWSATTINAAIVEAMNAARAAQSSAEAAQTSANTAQASADVAKASADSAQTSANAAHASADTAQQTADAAQASANTAQGTAEAAQAAAGAAQNTADTAQNSANAAHTSADSAQVTADAASVVDATFKVTGVDVGNFTDGFEITAGTSWQSVLKNMLMKRIPYKYTAPSLSLGITGSSNSLEAGSPMDLSMDSSYTKNDGGEASQVEFKKNGLVIHSDLAAPYSFVEPTYIIGDESISYVATVHYGDGPVMNDNMGDPSPEGQILAGTKDSPVRTYYGRRNLFFGVDNADNSSASIRALSGKILNPTNGRAFTIVIPAGARKVTFSYPGSLREVSSVKYREGLNAEIKDIFTLDSASQIEGANGFAPMAYKTYTYMPDAPFESEAHYDITI